MSEETMLAAIGALAASVAAIHAETNLTNQRMGLLLEMTGGIAQRHVVPLAGQMLGIFHTLGWLVVPQEDDRMIVHLAGGQGGHELGTMAVLRALVRAGDTVIDVGAHVGLLALPTARLVGPAGRVLALEPVPRSAESLRRTFAVNDLTDRCQVVEAAVSNENGLIDLFLGANSMLGTLLGHADGQASISVRQVTLDSLVPAGTRVDLVKIDAEGVETQVVEGMMRLVADNPDLFVIAEFGPSHLERFGIEPQAWFDIFARAGLDAFLCIDEATGHLSRRTVAELASVYSVNLLFYAHDNSRQEAFWPLLRANQESNG